MQSHQMYFPLRLSSLFSRLTQYPPQIFHFPLVYWSTCLENGDINQLPVVLKQLHFKGIFPVIVNQMPFKEKDNTSKDKRTHTTRKFTVAIKVNKNVLDFLALKTRNHISAQQKQAGLFFKMIEPNMKSYLWWSENWKVQTKELRRSSFLLPVGQC